MGNEQRRETLVITCPSKVHFIWKIICDARRNLQYNNNEKKNLPCRGHWFYLLILNKCLLEPYMDHQLKSKKNVIQFNCFHMMHIGEQNTLGKDKIKKEKKRKCNTNTIQSLHQEKGKTHCKVHTVTSVTVFFLSPSLRFFHSSYSTTISLSPWKFSTWSIDF